MNKSDMLFALLRKSSSVLKDGIKTNSERKILINIKYEYSKLDSTLRNLMRIMAKDVDRFDTVNGNNTVLTNTLLGNSSVQPMMVDTETGTTFKILKDSVVIDDITAFSGVDHQGFVVAFSCLCSAKKHREETIAKHALEQVRLNALSEYR